MKYITIILVALIWVTLKNINIYNQSIEITCDYDLPKLSESQRFVNNSVHNDWLRFKKLLGFSKKGTIHFSIDLSTKSVTCGFKGDNFCSPENTIATIYPDEVYIEQHDHKKGKIDFNSKTNKFYITHNIENSQEITNTFFIERDSGLFRGINYSLDPKTRQQIQTHINGKCKPIKRLF